MPGPASSHPMSPNTLETFRGATEPFQLDLPPPAWQEVCGGGQGQKCRSTSNGSVADLEGRIPQHLPNQPNCGPRGASGEKFHAAPSKKQACFLEGTLALRNQRGKGASWNTPLLLRWCCVGLFMACQLLLSSWQTNQIREGEGPGTGVAKNQSAQGHGMSAA